MGAATQSILEQQAALKADIDRRLADNPAFAGQLASAGPEGQAAFRADVLKRAAEKPEYRAYALFRQGVLPRVIDTFDQGLGLGLSDEELAGVLGEYQAGVEDWKNQTAKPAGENAVPASARGWVHQAAQQNALAKRAKLNAKDAFLGIEDVGSVSGAVVDTARFPLARLKQQIEQGEQFLASLEGGGSINPRVQGGLGTAYQAPIRATPELIERERRGLEAKRREYRETGLKYLKTLARRHGEYAGLPEWDGPMEGAAALLGQLGGALPSPENLIPMPGAGPVAGSIGKRIAVRAGRQAAENVAANLVTEPIVQQQRMATGEQEGISVRGALVRSGLGGVLGLGMGGLAGALGKAAPDGGKLKAESGELKAEIGKAETGKAESGELKAEPPVADGPGKLPEPPEPVEPSGTVTELEPSGTVTELEPSGTVTELEPTAGSQQRGFSETMEASDTTTAALKPRIVEHYDPITHPETLAEARTRLGGLEVNQAYEELMALRFRGPVETAMALETVNRLQHAGNEADLKRAANLAREVMRQGTETGQANSVLAIWNRLTPEGALMTAQRRLEEARAAEPNGVTPELQALLDEVDVVLATPLPAKVKAQAVKKTVAADGPAVWELYKQAAAKLLAKRLIPPERVVKTPAALQEMTARLTKWMSRRIPAPARKSTADPRRIRKEISDVLNNPARIPEILKVLKKHVPAGTLERLKADFKGLDSADLDRLVAEQLKQLDVSLADVIQGGVSGEQFLERQLPDLIVNQLGLSRNDARALAVSVQQRLKTQFTNLKSKELERIRASMERMAGGIVPKPFIEKFDKLERLGALDADKWSKLVSDYLKVPRLTPEMQRQIKELATAAGKATGEQQKLYHAAKLEMYLAGLSPKSAAAKLRAARVLAMLANVKTLVRNVGGNQFLWGGQMLADYVHAGVDPLLTRLTGSPRSQARPGMRARLSGLAEPVREFRQGFLIEFPKDTRPESLRDYMRGVARGLDYVATLGKLTSQNKFELGHVRGIADYAFSSQVGRALEKTLAIGLGVPDRAFWWSQFRASIDNERKLARMAGKSDTVTPDMIGRATLEAQRAIFQDDNLVSGALHDIRKGLNRIGVGGKGPRKDFGLGDVITPFVQVPGSLLVRGLEFSPAGWVRTAYEGLAPLFGRKFDQRAFAQSFSRGLVGTGSTIGLGYWLASIGVVTAPPPDDPDLQQLTRDLGLGGYQINLSALKEKLLTMDWFTRRAAQPGDLMMSYDWAQPLSMGVVMGADFHQWQEAEKLKVRSGQKAEKQVWMALDAIVSGAKSIQEQPLLAGLSGFFTKAERGSFPEAIKDTLLNEMPSSFVPTSVSQINQWQDNRVYETRGSDAFEEMMARVLARIPAAVRAAGFEPKPDQWGRVTERYPAAGNSWFNVFVNPAFMQRIKDDPVGREMLRLYESTGERGHIPRVAARSVKVNGVAVELTNEQLVEYQQYVGRATRWMYDALVTSPGWHEGPREGAAGHLLDSWRAKTLAGILTDIHAAAKVDLLGEIPGVNPSVDVDFYRALHKQGRF